MKRVIKSLNNMSFVLPKGWKIVEDKYTILNGQGFINKENYLSEEGKVISFFEIHRKPDEFFESYQILVESYRDCDTFVFEREFSIKFEEFAFPVYILRGTKGCPIYMAQVFVNCGDKLGCFMLTIDNYSETNKELISNNEAFSALSEILRSVE